MISERLLEILRCPMNPSEARLELDGNAAVCTQCGLRFKSKDGILNMVVEEAVLPEGCESLNDLPCRAKAHTERKQAK